MPPKKRRLTKNDFKKGRTKVFFSNTLFDVATIQGVENKVACVISKKTIKKAIDRNKEKRRFLNIIYKSIKNKNHISLVFFPKKTTHLVTNEKLKEEIDTFFATL